MGQEHKPGEIVPKSGIYTITHDLCTPTCRMRLQRDQEAGGSRPAGIARASASARACGQACRRNRSPRGGACAGFVRPARHGAAVSAHAQCRGRSAAVGSRRSSPSWSRRQHQQHRALDVGGTRRACRCRARSNPHPHSRRQEPRQGPRKAHGPPPFPQRRHRRKRP